MSDSKSYEAPKVVDLENLSLYGQWPLATDTCTVGSGQLGHSCAPEGSSGGSGVPNTCVSGTN
jgi:hypothetical protein